MTDIEEIIELNSDVLDELIKRDDFIVKYKNSVITLSTSENKIFKINVKTTLSNGKIKEYDDISSYKDKLITFSFDYAEKNSVLIKNGGKSLISDMFKKFLINMKSHFRLTIIICSILILTNVLFFCANFNLKYNKPYIYSGTEDRMHFSYEILFNRSNIAKITYAYFYDNSSLEDEKIQVNLYYVKDNQIYLNGYHTAEIKTPWTIVVENGEEKINLVCWSGIIFDIMSLITSGVAVYLIVYLFKSRKEEK